MKQCYSKFGKGKLMKELDIIRHAKNYMESLSERINPITKKPYDENSDMNNERLLKCFGYVARLLDRVIAEEEQKEQHHGDGTSEKPSSLRGSGDRSESAVQGKAPCFNGEQGKSSQNGAASNDEQGKSSQNGAASNGENGKVLQKGVAFNGEQGKVLQNGGISANDEPTASPQQERQDVGNENAYVKYDYVSNEPIAPNSIVPDDVMGQDVVDMLLKKGLIKQGTKK